VRDNYREAEKTLCKGVSASESEERERDQQRLGTNERGTLCE